MRISFELGHLFRCGEAWCFWLRLKENLVREERVGWVCLWGRGAMGGAGGRGGGGFERENYGFHLQSVRVFFWFLVEKKACCRTMGVGWQDGVGLVNGFYLHSIRVFFNLFTFFTGKKLDISSRTMHHTLQHRWLQFMALRCVWDMAFVLEGDRTIYKLTLPSFGLFNSVLGIIARLVLGERNSVWSISNFPCNLTRNI